MIFEVISQDLIEFFFSEVVMIKLDGDQKAYKLKNLNYVYFSAILKFKLKTEIFKADSDPRFISLLIFTKRQSLNNL